MRALDDIEDMNQELDVTIRDLAPVRVAMLEYQAGSLVGTYQESIGMLFREVEGWLKHNGYDPQSLRRFGVPITEGERLIRYWCCIETPPDLATASGPVSICELAGGRYAVLSMFKNGATIGTTINRFYTDYVPSHGLKLDMTRPPIEIYYPDTMDYCVPVHE